MSKNNSNKDKNDKRSRVLNQNKKGGGLRLELIVPLMIIVIGAAVFFIITGSQTVNAEGETVSALPANPFEDGFKIHTPVKANNGLVTFNLSDFDSGEAKYYSYKFPEKTIKFFIVKSDDGIVRAAFDACDVCYRAKRGYKQEGNVMVCNNCGQQFATDRINEEKGGCNPSPLKRVVQGNQLVISVSDISTGDMYF